jgi:hypothetical protein
LHAQYFKAQAVQKQAERDSMLGKLSPDQRERFLAEEDDAKQHDAAKSKHVLKTTALFKASGGKPLASGGGRGGRGGQSGRGK